MNLKQKTNIAIIGPGNVGQAFAQLFTSCGYDVVIGARNSDKHLPLKKAVKDADIILLTVSDHAIESVCNELADYFKHGSIIAHCSGALSSDCLAAARQMNCSVASLHPLNTFPNLDASLTLFANTKHNTYLYCEGDQPALHELLPIFESLGFNTVELSSKAKTAYHAACVFACNYLTALMDCSLQTAKSADIDPQQFWLAVQPLIQSTLRNISEQGCSSALSGPIARGDAITIQQHLDQLSKISDNVSEANTITDSYLSLGRHAITLAAQRGELTLEKLTQLEKILND